MGYLPPPAPTWIREAITCFTTDSARSFIVDTGDPVAAVDFVRNWVQPEGHWRFEVSRLTKNAARVDMQREQLLAVKNSCDYCGRRRSSANATCDGCGAPVMEDMP